MISNRQDREDLPSISGRLWCRLMAKGGLSPIFVVTFYRIKSVKVKHQSYLVRQ
jgi:hypothetical protein